MKINSMNHTKMEEIYDLVNDPYRDSNRMDELYKPEDGYNTEEYRDTRNELIRELYRLGDQVKDIAYVLDLKKRNVYNIVEDEERYTMDDLNDLDIDVASARIEIYQKFANISIEKDEYTKRLRLNEDLRLDYVSGEENLYLPGCNMNDYDE